MRKKLWISLALLFVIPGLLFTASCAKKEVMSEPAMEAPAQEESAADAQKAKEEELARQRAEEERLRQEAAMREAARNKFLSEDIHFEFDSSVLSQEAQGILGDKAEYLRNNPDVSVIVEGHCDERGTNEYNLALGDRRATSAKTYLVDLGVAEARLTTISYGEERPVDTGQNEEAWAKNRRAHFAID